MENLPHRSANNKKIKETFYEIEKHENQKVSKKAMEFNDFIEMKHENPLEEDDDLEKAMLYAELLKDDDETDEDIKRAILYAELLKDEVDVPQNPIGKEFESKEKLIQIDKKPYSDLKEENVTYNQYDEFLRVAQESEIKFDQLEFEKDALARKKPEKLEEIERLSNFLNNLSSDDEK